MARDDEESWRRRRQREEKKEEEALEEARTRTKSGESSIEALGRIGDTTERLDEFCRRAESLIDQVGSLYKQYVVGIEKFPPLELRKQLEELMSAMQAMAKPTAGSLFRFGTVQNKFSTHRDRWDRLIRDLESGKIKRTVGPKRG